MDITYYKAAQQEGSIIGNFGVFIPQWKMKINNLAAIKAKDGGWFVVPPSYKDRETDTWEKVVLFDDASTQKAFSKTAREALEKYATEHKIQLV